MRDAVVSSAATREAILDATDRLLARYGFKKMTIDDLASEVGIGKGSVYLHFPSKEEIALSHIDRLIERLKERMLKIAARKASTGERLKAMLVERVTFRFDSVQNYSQSLDELLSNLRTSLLDRRKIYFAEEARLLAEVVTEGQEAGVFKSGDAFDLGQTLVSATNSLLPYSLSAFELGD
ncbi:MAG: TetR/AcrR family transcriptional regulator, partial [Acidobacteria bacterium]|nr:TetR/AcrR family transcriptional regulator [Acidobacteriota bacterium]